MTHEKNVERIAQIKKTMRTLEKKIGRMPDGSFHLFRQRNSVKWIRTFMGKKTYIRKKDIVLAKQLCEKKYLLMRMMDLKQELKALEAYEEIMQGCGKADLLLDKPDYLSLLEDVFAPMSRELEKWSHAEYEKNPAFPEKLKQRSVSGHFLRSKSEAIIDACLFKNKIPFHYEEKIDLGGYAVYPDFVARHPGTGKIMIWEHFGMIDDPEYAKKCLQKLQMYIANGYYPSINLICTYETRENPLSMVDVEKVVEQYFL